ncbi:MAG: hypothetical protein WC595_04725 [Candidatus Nanoarchaeia archaeon]
MNEENLIAKLRKICEGLDKEEAEKRDWAEQRVSEIEHAYHQRLSQITRGSPGSSKTYLRLIEEAEGRYFREKGDTNLFYFGYSAALLRMQKELLEAFPELKEKE